MLKYGTKKMLPQHMNSILVEVWDASKVSIGNIIRYSFVKTNLPPLSTTNLTTNTQACAVPMQVSSRTNVK